MPTPTTDAPKTPTKSEMISFRSSPTLLELLDRLAKRENTDRSTVIRERLEATPSPTR